MPFYNRVRLPINLYRPQFPVERTQFRKANGEVVTLAAVIRKTYVGETDLMPENWHQRLVIALNHDTVFMQCQRFVGEVTLEENNYNINWVDFKDYPIAKADFAIQVTPFDATNVNCSSCEDLAQLELVDDTFPDPIAAGDSASMNVFANDEICCFPFTCEIVTINPTYVDSASIDCDTGILTVNILADAVDAAGAQLVTYRVTCPNGAFDDANVFGEIDGIAPAVCDSPTDLEISTISTNSAMVEAANLNNPFIKISLCSAPATILFTGAFTSPYIIGDHFSLSPGTCYQVAIYNFCDPEVSADLTGTFDTEDAPPESPCGQFNITLNDFRPSPLPSASVTYLACFGSNLTVNVPNHNTTPVSICAKTTTPGVPDYFTSNAIVGLTFVYVGPC